MTTEKKERTAADTLDAIFGEGSAAKMFSPEELEVARQPPEPYAIRYGWYARLKITPLGHVSPTHPQAPLGRHEGVRTVQINSIPRRVSLGEVVRLYASTIDMSDSPMWEFETLKPGRILR